MFIFVLLVIGAFVVYVMSPEERRRTLGRAIKAVNTAGRLTRRAHAQSGPFHEALRQRTRLPVSTAGIVLLNVLLFFRMVFADGSIADPETLVAWGASVGPRTTNGEWWRLLTATFVHSGLFHLLMDTVGIVMVGLLIERLAGSLAAAAVYVGAGIVANAAGLAADPMGVTTGACGAIFGVYGLLGAAVTWGLLQKSPLTIPLSEVRALAPSAGIFLFYSLVTGELSGPRALNGLMVGFVCGLGMTPGLGVSKTPALRSAAALVATLVVAAFFAVPNRGYLDVKPEIARVVAFEGRTATAYDKAVEQFKLGGINADALAQVIQKTILPELNAIRLRLKSFDRVPETHQSILASAQEYLRLRDESWRLRAEGLHKRDMLTLRKADRTEGASLDVLKTITGSSD
jgi:rhomboid protease GluP